LDAADGSGHRLDVLPLGLETMRGSGRVAEIQSGRFAGSSELICDGD
jgi:hypothetical protein